MTRCQICGEFATVEDTWRDMETHHRAHPDCVKEAKRNL